MIYLLHFERPYHHAQHYLGFTSLPINERLIRHWKGDGARLLKVIQKEGIGWKLVRLWEGDRIRERQLKQNTHKRKCPVCLGKVSYQEAETLVLSDPTFLNAQGGTVDSGTGTGRDATANADLSG